ncbi:MAG TPA: AAA family ATPase [Jiangellaceae bacterium]
MLLGRTAERAVIDDVLEAARAGHGAALVVRGEPGIGKTALLRYAEQQAGGLRTLRAVGVEGEAEVAFAGLHQLLRPLLAETELLPGPQSSAIRGALGLAPSTSRDPLLIGAALLTLLADAAAGGAVLCVVDDVQWLDQPSLAALMFAARRIADDGVAMLFGLRDDPAVRLAHAGGVRELMLSGLDPADGAAVLDEHTSIPPAESVRAQLVEASGGNPMALEEIGRTLTADQLRGRTPLPDPLPVGDALERVFADRARALASDARSLLVVAAAEDEGESALVLGAAKVMGLSPAALDDAEAAGLVEVGPDHIGFRHPLIRSAVYRTAAPSLRRLAHRSLAAACVDVRHADRRAWHLAAAALGPDSDIADALAETAQRAAARSGYAAAASALERSAALTEDGSVRAHRLVEAAGAAWLAGEVARATADLDRAAAEGRQDHSLTAGIAHWRGIIALRCGDVGQAYRILSSGAEVIADTDPDTALTMLTEALEAASYGGDSNGVAAAGTRALELWDRARSGGSTAEFFATISGGIGSAIKGRFDEATPLLQRGLELARASGEWRQLMQAGAVALYLGHIDTARDFFVRATEAVRSTGAIGALPYVLEYVLTMEGMAGELAAARSVGVEGIRLARETGQRTSEATLLARLAWVAALRGDDELCQAYADEALAIAVPNGIGLAVAAAEWSLGSLDMARGRWAAAAGRLARVMAAQPGRGHPIVALYAAPSCVEAALRAGDEPLARRVFAEYEPWADAGALPAHSAARCRGLLESDADEAVAHFERALAVRGVPVLERALTELMYGEVLRRARRRVEARAHLRSALEVFDRARAEPWAERARLELRATGETVRQPGPTPVDQLTPQELQISQLVAAGASNREVAAKLFLSPRTVEYHLYKVYPKLGIGSRAELAAALELSG